MILLDTHIWIWWMNDEPRLTPRHRDLITANGPTGLGVSVMSCWELSQLVNRGRLSLAIPPLQWIEDALTHPHVVLLELTPRIAVEANQLPTWEHRDPVDRILVGTARVLGCPILTVDQRILDYPDVLKP